MEKEQIRSDLKFQTWYWWYEVRRRLLKNLIPKYIHFQQPLKWLDAGCGGGANTLLFQSYGEVYGIDIDKNALAVAKELVPSAHFVHGSLTALPFEDDFFHVVSALDIIEHIKEEAKALHEVYRVLKPKGFFIVTVPAFQWLWSAFDEASYHYRRYTITSLKKALTQTGFHIKKISYFFFSTFPIFVFQRKLLLKNKKLNQENLIPSFSPFLNKILLYTCLWETHFLKIGKLPWGSSIIAIAQKPEN